MAARVAALGAAILVVPTVLFAQEAERPADRARAAQLIGVVTDISTEAPVEGAAIRLFDADGAAVETRTADTAGRFAFPSLAAGAYALEIGRIGYGTVRTDVELGTGARTFVTVELVPDAVEMEPVVVATTRRSRLDAEGFDRRRRAGIGSFITREEIEERNPVLLSDMLRRLPGIQAVSLPGRFRSDVVMRGQCRPALIVDGIHLPHFGAFVIDDYFTMTDIEAIEVYRGPQTPAQFSYGTCGSVVVWTRVPERVQGRHSLWRNLLIGAGALGAMLLLTQ